MVAKLCRSVSWDDSLPALILLGYKRSPGFFIAENTEVLILKKNRRNKNQVTPGTKSGRCPYCGSPIIFRSADGIYKDNSHETMLYACSRYPECDAYVRVSPGTKTAIGSMANGVLRALRREAHEHFDRLHLSGLMTRREAYEWLANMLQAPLSHAHIGHLGEYYCREVIVWSKRMLENRREVQGGQAIYAGRRSKGGEVYAAY
jgi:ssDNA-binding Zn-finger/Zn-ribbon topoisomerase 1